MTITADPAFTTGDVAGRPVAVANVLAGPRTLAQWIEDKFAPFVITLAGQPGFLAFRLLAVPNNGRRCVIISLSLWEDVAWFRAWQAGTGFAAAHLAARGNPKGTRPQKADAERYSLLDQARFDFPCPRAGAARTMSRLEGPLLARLEQRFNIDPAGACFSVLLELPELAPGVAWGGCEPVPAMAAMAAG